jgi:hypothetical protein
LPLQEDNSSRFEAAEPSNRPQWRIENCGFRSCPRFWNTNQNPYAWNWNTLVQSTLSSAGAKAIQPWGGYLGSGLHFRWANWEEAFVLWRQRDWPDIQNIPVPRHSHSQGLAKYK